MKILIVIDQYDNGNNGTTMSARRFVEALEKRGHEVSIVSTAKPKPNKYIVKKLPLTPLVSHIVSSQGMCFAIPSKKVLAKAMSNCDVVHFYMPFGLSSHGLKIAKELNVPHTAAFHVQPENITYTIGLGKSEKVNDKIYEFYRDHFFNKFKHIHCPSNFIANELKKHGYTANLHVISNGIDPKFHYQKQKKSEELENKFVITMIGRYSNEKRQDVLIDAIYKSKYSDDIQLVLAGKGLNEEKYRELGKDLKNPPILKFYNNENLVSLLAMSDLYVHAADAEIEAISCIEAFSSGLVPIIANSKKSATPQFALNENSLFTPGDSIDLAHKIDYWIEHTSKRQEQEKLYAESGLKYHIENSIIQIEEMFEDAIREYNR